MQCMCLFLFNTTLYLVTNKSNDTSLQGAVTAAIKKSKANSKNINTTTSKEMLTSYAREKHTIPMLPLRMKTLRELIPALS